jgi:hypothetical protein
MRFVNGDARHDLPTAAVPGPAPAPDDGPIWLTAEEVPRDSWPAPRLRVGRPRGPEPAPARTPPKAPPPMRSVRAGLAAMVAFALVASFFAWVTAEPLWLALGRGQTGTAAVADCTGAGVAQRCHGDFTAADGGFTAQGVRLFGVADAQREAGTAIPARMVAADSGTAYVSDAAVMHLRWILGLAFVLASGAGTLWATGALRLADRRSRRRAALTAFFAPLLVTVGFLAASF